MRPLAAVAAAAALAVFPVAVAQVLPAGASSSFPQCALGCPALHQAQGACDSNKGGNGGVKACFCQSSQLAPLKSGADSMCSDVCPNVNDRKTIQSWFSDTCKQHATSTSTTLATSVSQASGPTSTSGAPPSGVTPMDMNSTKFPLAYQKPPPWIKHHYRWIIMIVILILFFAALGVALEFFRRREARRFSQYAPFIPGHPGMTSRPLAETKGPGMPVAPIYQAAQRMSRTSSVRGAPPRSLHSPRTPSSPVPGDIPGEAESSSEPPHVSYPSQASYPSHGDYESPEQQEPNGAYRYGDPSRYPAL